MNKWQSFIVLILFLVASKADGQQRYNITFDNIGLDSAILQLEKEMPFQFYFRDSWLEGKTISKELADASLEEVMESLLEGHKLNYVVIENRIIITNNTPILTEFKNDESSNDDLQYLFEREYEASSTGQVLTVGNKSKMKIGEQSLLAGFVKSRETGDPVVGAIVYVEGSNQSAISDGEGFYTINLPNGENEVKVQFSGLKTKTQNIILFSDGNLDMELEQEAIILDEVSVFAEADQNISNVNMGVSKLKMEEVKNVPKVLGENDLVQVALTLPGVQSIGEGASGINVRGGKTDQNLILFNNATIYNPSHFFGFFSVFNADITGETELYKSSIPVNYGGRLSSLLDVKMKIGNKEEFKGKIGISPVTSQFGFEVPIIKEKTSATVGLRTTYSDWILDRVENESIRNSDPSFFDFSAGIHHSYEKNSSISVSTYYSKDQFKISTDSLYNYFNFNSALNWNHFINNKLSTQVVAAISQYSFNIAYDEVPESSFDYGFDIQDIFGQISLNYFPNDQHEIQFGLDSRLYDLSPGSIQPLGELSEVIPESIDEESGRESALFVSNNYTLNKNITLYAGLRYSFFSALGARSVNFYDDSLPRDDNSLLFTRDFNDGQQINQYQGPEFRFSLKYALSSSSSIKASFNQTRQYLHALSNNVSISPTDTWKLSDPNFLPQLGKQFSVGYFKNYKANTIEASIEAYYKTLDNLLDYKVGADLVLNPLIETDVLQGEGRAYGIELLVKKNAGKINGWFSYTYSRSQQRFDSEFAEERINNGDFFPTNFEKPHDLSLISNYRHNRRFSVSLNINYSTGRPITYPTGKFQLAGTEIVHFSDRNQFRLPDYFRIDLSFNLEGSHRVRKIGHGYWSFSIYNLTGRNNVYSIFFANNDGEIQGFELSVLGNAIPSITYNLKF